MKEKEIHEGKKKERMNRYEIRTDVFKQGCTTFLVRDCITYSKVSERSSCKYIHPALKILSSPIEASGTCILTFTHRNGHLGRRVTNSTQTDRKDRREVSSLSLP
jgi:hypothetical protein